MVAVSALGLGLWAGCCVWCRAHRSWTLAPITDGYPRIRGGLGDGETRCPPMNRTLAGGVSCPYGTEHSPAPCGSHWTGAARGAAALGDSGAGDGTPLVLVLSHVIE